MFRVVLVVLSVVFFACSGAPPRITLDDLRAMNPTAAVEKSCDRVHGDQGELHLSVRRGDENVHFFEDSGERMIEAARDEKAIITVYEPDSAACVANAQANANRTTKQASYRYGVVWTISAPQGDLPRIRLPEETRSALESSLRTECSSAPVSVNKGVLGQTLTTTTDPNQRLKKAQEITDIIRRTLRGSVNELLVCGGLGCKTVNEMRAQLGQPALDPNAESPIDSPAAQFAGGAGAALPGVLAPGGAIVTQALIDQGVLPKGTRWAQAGKGAMELGAGGLELFIAADGAIAGGGMMLTGGGAVVGAPLAMGSVALGANAIGTMCTGAKTLTIALFRWEEETPPSAPSSQPATSTPSTSPPAQPAAKPAAQPPQAAPAKPAVKPAVKPAQAAQAKTSGTGASGKPIDPKDIKGAQPFGKEGRPGHPFAHGVSRDDIASVINDPKSAMYRGTNTSTPPRPIDFYHRDGTTVITEQGDPTRVITAFGRLSTKNASGQPILRGTGKPSNAAPSGVFTKLR